MAERHSDLTPYNYVMNNPLLYGDELGMDTTKVHQLAEVKITAQKPKNALVINSNARWNIHYGYKVRDGNTVKQDNCQCPVFRKYIGSTVRVVLPLLLADFGGEFLSDSFFDALELDIPPTLRASYEAEVMNLQSIENEMRAAGASDEEIATTLQNMRREIGVKYKELTPPDMLNKIYERNLNKYGDKLGPSIDYLRGQGKSWEDIINSAKRPGGKDLGF